MVEHFDNVVVGQGLAGTALVWHLLWAGKRILVLDRGSLHTSSRVAAGLVTPITGQRLTKSWRFDEFWSAALEFYRHVETSIQQGSVSQSESRSCSFFRTLPMIRLLVEESDLHALDRRGTNQAYQPHIKRLEKSSFGNEYQDVLGAIELKPGGQLDVETYLNNSRSVFEKNCRYEIVEVDPERDLRVERSQVHIPRLNIVCRNLTFCQGIDAATNSWFRRVKFKPAKGESLIVRIPGFHERRVVHAGIWIAPEKTLFHENHLYRIGSTYNWDELNCVPTPEARDQLVQKAERLISIPVEVIHHSAGIRPIHFNQYPILGRHPDYSTLSFFNGLGSKGALQAPFFARQLEQHLEGQCPIDEAVDLNRKTELRGCHP